VPLGSFLYIVAYSEMTPSPPRTKRTITRKPQYKRRKGIQMHISGGCTGTRGVNNLWKWRSGRTRGSFVRKLLAWYQGEYAKDDNKSSLHGTKSISEFSKSLDTSDWRAIATCDSNSERNKKCRDTWDRAMRPWNFLLEGSFNTNSIAEQGKCRSSLWECFFWERPNTLIFQYWRPLLLKN